MFQSLAFLCYQSVLFFQGHFAVFILVYFVIVSIGQFCLLPFANLILYLAITFLLLELFLVLFLKNPILSQSPLDLNYRYFWPAFECGPRLFWDYPWRIRLFAYGEACHVVFTNQSELEYSSLTAASSRHPLCDDFYCDCCLTPSFLRAVLCVIGIWYLYFLLRISSSCFSSISSCRAFSACILSK